jgi:hypothetical protein
MEVALLGLVHWLPLRVCHLAPAVIIMDSVEGRTHRDRLLLGLAHVGIIAKDLVIATRFWETLLGSLI